MSAVCPICTAHRAVALETIRSRPREESITKPDLSSVSGRAFALIERIARYFFSNSASMTSSPTGFEPPAAWAAASAPG